MHTIVRNSTCKRQITVEWGDSTSLQDIKGKEYCVLEDRIFSKEVQHKQRHEDGNI